MLPHQISPTVRWRKLLNRLIDDYMYGYTNNQLSKMCNTKGSSFDFLCVCTRCSDDVTGICCLIIFSPISKGLFVGPPQALGTVRPN